MLGSPGNAPQRIKRARARPACRPGDWRTPHRPGHDQPAPMYYCYLDIEISAEAHCDRHPGKAYLT